MSDKLKGIILAITAAVLWALCGIATQILFKDSRISSEWLVEVRLMLSGLLLIIYGLIKNKNNLIKVWNDRTDIKQLVIFSFLGMTGMQYTYFMAIKEGNAASATVLQFLCPVIIVCFLIIYKRKIPQKLELLAIGTALTGTFLFVTKGNINSFSISVPAFSWGIASAFAMAFYTLQPKKLLDKYDSPSIVGWAMIIGGIVFNIIHPIWDFDMGILTIKSVLYILFIVIFGTLLSFLSYLQSLKYIEPSIASLLCSVEPLSASVLSIFIFGAMFGSVQWIATLLIISTVFILSKSK